MSSFINNKQKNFKEDKFLYFIPCYDIINNEIFFSEFFTEKIISKTKIDNKISIKDRDKTSESTQSKYQYSSGSKSPKKRNKKNQKKKKNKNNYFNIKDNLTEPKYKKIKNEFPKFKSDNKSVGSLKGRKKIDLKEINNEKEKTLIEKFILNWKKMKIISGFNENNYLSENYIKYFSRPLYNRFFHSENLNLYSYNSTLPLSSTMSNKLYINLYIHYDLDSFFTFPKNKADEYIINYIKSTFMVLSQSPRQVGLFYVVDTLIKDSLKVFENYILNLLDNLDSYNNLDEFLQPGDSDSLSVIGSEENMDLKEREDMINDEETKNKIYEFLILIKKKFTMLKSDLNNRFIFKFYDSEEFLYGDHTLGSYNYIRNKARQHEGINLILQYYPLQIISPLLMSYPPIIRINEQEVSYDNLLELYINLFPKNKIVYRLFKPTKSMINRYYKNDKKRTKYLSKYTESGDCDFPIKIKIKKLNNINCFKQWLTDEIYNNIDIHLPYFNTLKKYSMQTENNFFKNIFCCCSKTEANNKKEESNILNNTQTYLDFITKFNKNKKEEKELIKKLNPYNFLSNYKSEKYNIYYKILLTYIEYPMLYNFEKEQKNKNKADEILLNDITFKNDIYLNKFMPPFTLSKYPLLFIPIYIRIKIYILYGCFCIKKFYTQPYLLKDFIILNESITLDGNECLISHLPLETRIGFTIKAFDSKLEKKFILGSCQIPLYKDTGEFNSGEIEYQFWPNVKIFPRVVFNTPFSRKIKKIEKFENIIFPILDDDDDKVIKLLEKYTKYISPDLKKIKIIKEEENFLKEKNMEEKYRNLDNNNNKNDEEDEESKEEIEEKEKNFEEYIEDDILDNKNINKIGILKEFKNIYPSITIELPKFSKPLIHNTKKVHGYKQFLEIKYKDKDKKDYLNSDFDEFKNLFANSKIDIKNVMDSLSNKYSDEKEILENEVKKENENDDIYKYLKKVLPLFLKILKKDPLEPLTQEDIKVILICRDYLTTIPSGLELFLRSINWFNPLEVSLAHKYLKKWSKLTAEDALSLLDCCFPDTKVRLYAINILREYPDEIIHNLMLILCQCLLYENFIVNPLADFLIERSLKNPKLIGNSFICYNRVNMKNPFLEEKLSAYILQFLMLCGNKYLNECFSALENNYYLELFTFASKREKEMNKNKVNKNKNKLKTNNLIDYYNKAIFKENKINILIDPSCTCYKLTDYLSIESSNFIQTLITFKAGLNEESPEKKIILRLGNDLRPDILAIQILKIMDKLWLDNNLDLKLTTFSICPSEIFAGYIEYVNFSELYKIQNSSGIIGVLDKEAIIKFLRGNTNMKNNANEIYENDTYEERVDNFIKSLAGYCVATCVLGITERSFRNVMIKNNGILLHINLGHLLGHFKYKCGIKTERSLFLLTPEMANVYISENKQELFKKCCTKAFNILRHNASKIINPFIIMSTAGLKDFYGINDIKYIKKMLVLDKMNDEEAGNYFLEQIWKCKNEKLRQIDSLFSFMK